MEEDIHEAYENIQEDMIEECTVENEEDINVLNHDSDSLLIELVEGYPHIYDNRNPEFKDVGKKEQAWNEIAAAMDWPVPECQNRWLRLREKYARETRAMDLEINGGMPPKRRTMFALYEKMNFLKNHVKRRRTYPKILSEASPQNHAKRSNVVQVHIPTLYTTNLSNRSTLPSIVTNTTPPMALSSKPLTNTNQPAIVQIHQPALVQIIKPVRVSTTEETTPKSGTRSSDVMSTRVGGLVITQSTSENFEHTDEKVINYVNGESPQVNTADSLFGQFVAAELLKLPEPQRKQMKQKIVKILYE